MVRMAPKIPRGKALANVVGLRVPRRHEYREALYLASLHCFEAITQYARVRRGLIRRIDAHAKFTQLAPRQLAPRILHQGGSLGVSEMHGSIDFDAPAKSVVTGECPQDYPREVIVNNDHMTYTPIIRVIRINVHNLAMRLTPTHSAINVPHLYASPPISIGLVIRQYSIRFSTST